MRQERDGAKAARTLGRETETGHTARKGRPPIKDVKHINLPVDLLYVDEAKEF